MNFLFAVLGALVGGALGSAGSALAFALAGAIGGWWWSSRRRAASAQDAPSDIVDSVLLRRRLEALEREVQALRQQMGVADAGATPSPAAKAEPLVPVLPVVPVANEAPAPKPAPALPVTIQPAAVNVAAVAPPPVITPAPPRAPVAPPPPPVPLRDRLPPFLARWIFGGNTIVKVGVLILFLGLAFLLRYTAERVTLPVEWRFAGVALVGVALTALGWRLRDRRDAAGGSGYGLILQGAGIGLFYLTTLGALRLEPLLSPSLAFAFMALVALFGAILAVLQDAPWLALVAVAEGFAAPVLVSTGSGAYVPLMSYMAILDAGILAMAWFKAWRPLNLVGAVATFSLAGAWAHAHYVDADYPGVQAFLLFFFLLFTVTGVLFARRALAAGDEPSPDTPLAARAADALRHVGRVDSTLTFGVPLAAFSLQYLLVRDMAWGPAWAAAGFALFHILLCGILMRATRPRYALLGEAHVIVGTIFATLAIPLALQGTWTGATWAIEAAGMYWLGTRQRRAYARAFALAVMLGAALRLVAGLSLDLRADAPLLAGSTLGVAMLAVALAALDAARRRVAADARNAVDDIAAATVPFAAALTLATLAWMTVPLLWAGALTAWIAFGCAALAERLAAPSLRVACGLLHLGAICAATAALQGTNPDTASPHALQDLVAVLLVGVALLATGWLGLRNAWREASRGTPRPLPLGSSVGLVAGLAVASLSLLFELAPAEAAIAWPVIGLAAAAIGVRLRSGALVGSGFALQVAAGVTSVFWEESVWNFVPAGVAVASTLWIPLVLSATGLWLGDLLRAAQATGRRAWWHATPTQWVLVAWTLAWWSRVLPPLAWHWLQAQLPGPDTFAAWPHWQLVWVTFTALAAVALARWRDWRVLGQATLATVPAWIALASVHDGAGVPPSEHLGWIAWPLALAAHPLLHRLQARWRPARVGAALQVAGGWLFVALGTLECLLRVQAVAGASSAWTALAEMAVPALVLIGSTRPAWLHRLDAGWRVIGCGAIAFWLFAWLWRANTGPGDAAPLPWVPLLNPLEVGQGVALLAIVAWVRTLDADWRARLPSQALPIVGGATAFALVTGMVLRTCHHWAGIAWSADALYASTLAQAALSVTWSLIGVALMVTGHRGLRRVMWGVGAALLGLVVAKLFLVELADRGTLSRIVSFIVVGGLMLAVGYFAPIPPRRHDAEDPLAGAPA